jgi:hypothetical protein
MKPSPAGCTCLLVYPCLNCASMCRGLGDLEIQCLDNEFHCGSCSVFETKGMAHRGVWVNEGGNDCEDLRFYPQGNVITEW